MVCVRETDMKQSWCLAASSTDETARDLTWFYGSRWGIEAGLRDTKDRRGSDQGNTPDAESLGQRGFGAFQCNLEPVIFEPRQHSGYLLISWRPIELRAEVRGQCGDSHQPRRIPLGIRRQIPQHHQATMAWVR